MSKPLVMVVDDEPDVANCITNIIEDTQEYQVITCYSAHEALEQLKKNKTILGLGGNHIRFILLDIKMPEMDGLELLAKIRHDFGEDIGIAMLTAWEDEEKWNRATAGFVVNYIKKPFDSEVLLSTLDSFFEGQESGMVLKTFEKHLAKKDALENKT